MKDDRKRQIFDLCRNRQSVTVDEIVKLLHVSPATVRRLLQEMEDENMIKRFYGGAIINNEQLQEQSLNVRELSHIEEKKALARYAASLIQPNDMVYIDGGSTTSRIIDYITAKDILVITQGINNIVRLNERGIKCYVIGGYLRQQTGVLVGTEIADRMRSMTFSKSFVGANGANPLRGFTTMSEEEGTIKRIALEQSKQPYIVMDSSKFNLINNCRFADFGTVTLITDSIPDGFDPAPLGEVRIVSGKSVRELHKLPEVK